LLAVHAGEQTKPKRYQFACRQHRVSLDFHVKGFFRHEELAIHYFETFAELVATCQRHDIDAILIAGHSDFTEEIQLVQAIKGNVFLSGIPIILYHPDPWENVVVSAYENGVEEFIYGEWRNKLVEVRIRRLVERSRRDISVNPSTRLPGPGIIETEINRQLQLDATFAVCYADLDNFKAYNDYYGYVHGDKVIKLTARVIKDIVYDLCPEGFVGHVAGDDFVYTVPSELVKPVCEKIISTFDTLIPYRYAREDRERGYIAAFNRKGNRENFGMLTISIAVIMADGKRFSHVGQLSKMLADLKKAAKMQAGSVYLLERRKPY
jgi:diguanylate cyclase (GGDEF)-like protein